MNWIYFSQVAYVILIVAVCLIILYNTRSHNKTLAFILLVCFVPFVGIVLYFLIGFNFHKSKLFGSMTDENKKLRKKLNITEDNHDDILQAYSHKIKPSQKTLANFIYNATQMPITAGNDVQLLINGENKFPEVHKLIREAKHHIHLEYYIFNSDETAEEIVDLLVEKAKKGIKIKFIYDDLGSRSIRRKLVPKMKEAGIDIQPFYEIKFLLLANRINYRNHRKIIVIDGEVGFVGGINVGNEYNNDLKNKLYWRDTHMIVRGPIVKYLQTIFLQDWNFCNPEEIIEDDNYFPTIPSTDGSDTLVQIAASGPDTQLPYIEYSMLKAIYSAQREILITTPYFIPGESVMDALITASKSGVKVKMLVPKESDSKVVDAAARSYYNSLIANEVEVYMYEKGFIHSKSMIIDDNLTILGSANMDNRSFDLNFEVNAIVYDDVFVAKMKDIFDEDKSHAEKIESDRWMRRSYVVQLPEKLARLISPIL